ncbi:MAG: dTDP-4-dehydrorhamnose 3,5-epimerase family protein, partial [Actinomycetota bacterium]
LVLEPAIDDRGAFMESWRKEWFPDFEPAQGNLSWSEENVLRGLHVHRRQADVWNVVSGRARIALVDLRPDSPTRLATAAIEVDTDEERVCLLIPPGVAHGFYARSPVLLQYLVDRPYDGGDELGLAWDDPALSLGWPSDRPLLSERDRSNPSLAEALEALATLGG